MFFSTATKAAAVKAATAKAAVSKAGAAKAAGKVIGSGGFGCVFFPAIKCKNKKTNTKGKISKMNVKEEAKKD